MNRLGIDDCDAEDVARTAASFMDPLIREANLGRTPAEKERLLTDRVFALWGEIEGQIVGREDEALSPACAKGCTACCYLSVDATAAEARVVLEFLVNTKTPEELALIDRRLSRQCDARRQHRDLDAYLSRGVPCAFLNEDTGACDIYFVRPLTCRTHHSLRREACDAGLAASRAGQDGADMPVPKSYVRHAVATALQNAFLAALLGTVRGLKRAPRPKDLSRWTQTFFPYLLRKELRRYVQRTKPVGGDRRPAHRPDDGRPEAL